MQIKLLLLLIGLFTFSCKNTVATSEEVAEEGIDAGNSEYGDSDLMKERVSEGSLDDEKDEGHYMSDSEDLNEAADSKKFKYFTNKLLKELKDDPAFITEDGSKESLPEGGVMSDEDAGIEEDEDLDDTNDEKGRK